MMSDYYGIPVVSHARSTKLFNKSFDDFLRDIVSGQIPFLVLTYLFEQQFRRTVGK